MSDDATSDENSNFPSGSGYRVAVNRVSADDSESNDSSRSEDGGGGGGGYLSPSYGGAGGPDYSNEGGFTRKGGMARSATMQFHDNQRDAKYKEHAPHSLAVPGGGGGMGGMRKSISMQEMSPKASKRTNHESVQSPLAPLSKEDIALQQEFIKAVKGNKKSKVIEMLNKDFAMSATKGEHEATIRTVIRRGGRHEKLPWAADKNGDTALHIAIENGNKEIMVRLLSHSANPNARGHKNITPVMVAASRRDGVEYLELLLKKPENNLDLADDDGNTAIHFAAAKGNVAVILFLKGHGFSFTERNELGDTPLHNAARAQKSKTVAELIALGADMHEMNRAGITPTQLAKKGKVRQVFDMHRRASPHHS